MTWSVWLAVGLGFAMPQARPAIVAPKPAAPIEASSCSACRSLAGSPATAPVVPVHDGPSVPITDATPEPLVLPDDASPLPPAMANPQLRDLVDHHLPHASDEEREAWTEELRHLPTEVARDLLAARSSFGEPGELPNPPLAGRVPPPQWEPILSPSPISSPSLADTAVTAADSGATLFALSQAEAARLHNIANADSIGFKRLRPLTAEAAGTAGLAGFSLRRVETQGELDETHRSLDLAIDGPGFFQVRRGETVALTRRGTFHVTVDGTLALEVDGEDWFLDPVTQLPSDTNETQVGDDGVILCRLPGGEELAVGQIELARAADFSRLEAIGGGLFAVPEAAGPVAVNLPGDEGYGRIRQGRLERSNVDLTSELAALRRLRRQMAALQAIPAPRLAMPGSIESTQRN